MSNFSDTMDEAIRLHRKVKLLQERVEAALGVAVSLAARGEATTPEIIQYHEIAKAEGVPGRGTLQRLRVECARLMEPGEVVHRVRGATAPWPKAPAFVYLLLLDGVVVYVGKSINPRDRMPDHARNKQWDAVDLIACASEVDALRLEGDLIYHHQPDLNRSDRRKRRFVSGA